MLNYYLKTIKWDKDLPHRAKMIDLYTRVYNGTIYDHLRYYFFQEREDGLNGQYIKLQLRQPSVKQNFCKLVVDDSVSLLFGNDHFPRIACKDTETRQIYEDIIEEFKINSAMIRAATIGSAGSVILFINVYEGVLRIKPKCTKYITPEFDATDCLLKVTEKYKVSGKELIEKGYDIQYPGKIYWFHKEWDKNSEIYYIPYLCEEKTEKPAIDKGKTIVHNLGVIPAVWIKNLPRILDNDENGECIDGECTFARAVDTNIEIDYQLSQVGRALKYSSDPLLVLKLEDDGMTLQQNSVNTVDSASGAFIGNGGSRGLARSASNAIVLNQKDEANLLEISGEACNAVLEYVRNLREYMLETIHGNRSNADKVNVSQSAAAMKALNQALIWLTDNLRVSYGAGLLDVLKIIAKITSKPGFGILVKEKIITNISTKEAVTLSWPSWYPHTPTDKVQNANSLKILSDIDMISKETGTASIANDYDIHELEKEKANIQADRDAINALNPAVKEVQAI